MTKFAKLLGVVAVGAFLSTGALAASTNASPKKPTANPGKGVGATQVAPTAGNTTKATCNQQGVGISKC